MSGTSGVEFDDTMIVQKSSWEIQLTCGESISFLIVSLQESTGIVFSFVFELSRGLFSISEIIVTNDTAEICS